MAIDMKSYRLSQPSDAAELAEENRAGEIAQDAVRLLRLYGFDTERAVKAAASQIADEKKRIRIVAKLRNPDARMFDWMSPTEAARYAP